MLVLIRLSTIVFDMSRGYITHCFFISLLVIIGVASFYTPWKLTPLNGVFEPTPVPELTPQNWHSGTFQKRAEQWVDQNIGFKAWFVKTDNQINHWLFQENHQKAGSKILLGKNGHLYEQAYIDAWLGRDAVSKEELRTRIHELETLDHLLREHGSKLVVLIAPTKASFFPENIPNDRKQPTIDDKIANYDQITPLFSSSSLTIIDAHAQLLAQKNSSSYPLFTKSGTHWTRYASCLVANRLITALQERARQATCDAVDVRAPEHDDRDLLDLANIWHETPHLEMVAYPRNATQTANPLRFLLIGDSFSWGLLRNIRDARLALDYDFLYYFQTHYRPNGRHAPTPTSEQALRNIILQNDAVVIEIHDGALTNPGYGFVKAAMEALK